MTDRLRRKPTLSEAREIQCKEWADNPEVVRCLRSILAWSEENTCDADRVAENLYDWVNNIIWYMKMMDIDPVFLRKRR